MTATVHAHNEKPNGEAAIGTIVITVNTADQVIRDPAGNIAFQGPAAVQLVAGEATFTLPASDDETLEPSGFTFTATEQLKHVAKSSYRSVDFQTVDGATLHLADLASSDEVALDPSYGANLNGLTARVVVLEEGGTEVADATTTTKGIVELATNAEAINGTDLVRAVTPAGVAAAVGAAVPAPPTLSTKTANYTMTTSDAAIIANGSSLTITLPSAVTAGATGKTYTVKNRNATSATLAASAGLIDGSATQLLATNESLTVVSDGTNWLVV